MKLLVNSESRRLDNNPDGSVPTDAHYVVKFFRTVPQFKCVKLVHCAIPNMQLTVITGWNNTIQLADSVAGDVTLTIPAGIYDGPGLAAAILAVGGTQFSAVTFSSTGKLVFTAQAGRNITFYDQQTSYSSSVLTTPGTWELIGLGIPGQASAVVVAGGTTVSMPNCAQLFQPSAWIVDVSIGTANISTGILDSDGQHSFLVPNVANYGSYAYYGEMNDFMQGVRNDNQMLSELEVKVSTVIKPRASYLDSNPIPTWFTYPVDFCGISNYFLFELVE